MLYNYDMIYEKAVEEAQKTYTTSLSDREYLESFLEFSYILYNQEISSKTGEAKISLSGLPDRGWIGNGSGTKYGEYRKWSDR